MTEVLDVEISTTGVAHLRLNRPEKHNALDAGLIAALAETVPLLAMDEGLRAVVLTGNGASFCAGGDLGWMRDQMAADAATRAANARGFAAMLGALDALPMPLIARVNGPAYGGGVGLIAVCDCAIGVDTARFGLTETRLGLIPAMIGPYVLARIGAAASRRWMVNARLFGADEAVRLGLLSEAVAPEALDAAVEAEVTAHLAAAPGAVRAVKRLVRDLGGRVGPEAVEASVAALLARWESAEAQEGVAAFFARRKPDWVRE